MGTALIGVGGVVVGVILKAVIDHLADGKKQAREEKRELLSAYAKFLSAESHLLIAAAKHSAFVHRGNPIDGDTRAAMKLAIDELNVSIAAQESAAWSVLLLEDDEGLQGLVKELAMFTPQPDAVTTVRYLGERRTIAQLLSRLVAKRRRGVLPPTKLPSAKRPQLPAGSEDSEE